MMKHSINSRLLSLLLVLAMVFSIAPVSVFAAVGDLSNVSTGLTGDIDTADTISLPIKIYDYEADGMLFEYAEAYAPKDADDFGASASRDYTGLTALPGNGDYYGDYWSSTEKTINTDNENASFIRFKFAKAASGLSGVATTWSSDKRAGIIIPNNLEVAINDARYLVLVYRSNVTTENIEFFVERSNKDRYNSNNDAGNHTFTSVGTTNWTYAVYDLKNGNLKNDWNGTATAIWTTLPIDASGEYIDIAHIALFANEDQANAFGEYALTDGSDRGDNRGFGLLRGSRHENDNGTEEDGRGSAFPGIYVYNNTDAEYGNAAATLYQIPWNTTSTLDLSTVTNLGYTLLGTVGKNNIANIGLLESAIGSNGYPVYKEEVVTYLAYLLKHSLEIDERTSDGWKNYRYVKGTASSVYGGTDLATALRNKIKGNTGSYAAASGKDLVGTWAEVGGNIASYYDAAYFLLNSIFVSGSYNEEQDDYNYLILSAGTDSTSGDKVYVFDGGFSTSSDPETAEMAINYDTDTKTIQNTSAAGKAHFVYEGDNTTTLNPFLPITDKIKNDPTITPYYQDDGVINGVKKQTTKDTLYQRNYNFAMVSEGEFVYHADDELFFEFEGDDDVYLFINGELVMDIGSAHSIDSVRFELNDYVNAAKAETLGSDKRNAALALEEGNTYSFKFYYMERHSYGSNIRICTNIKVTDPSMTTNKTAWQDGIQLDFGSIVDKDKVVEYGFSITNNGEENLYNLTFTDNDIGVTLDYENGLTVTNNGTRVFDVNGGTLEASDLTALVTHPDYADITVTFADNDALKAFLASLTSDAVVENGGGLWIGSTVLIRGIGYKLSDEQIKKGVFDNTVFTTSTNSLATKTLYGQADMRVFVPADPMYYEWAGHDLKVTKTKLITDVLAAANQADNILNGKVSNLTTSNVNKIELVTKAGNAITSPYVTIDSSYNLTIKYDTVGSKVFYVKVTYNSSKNTVVVPVLVNVTDVEDSYIVLDYGLPVDIPVSELTKNDTLTVPGRTTKTDVLGYSVADGTYSPNEITFVTGNLTSDYGTFAISEDKKTVTFTPTAFLEDEITIYMALNVYESDITPSAITNTLSINKEVEMYKTITILPATVMYYEDDFPSIEYNTEKLVEPENEGDNTSTDFGTQTVDQDSNYGSDPRYADASNTDMSGGSVQKLLIDSTDTLASFTFTGTGFELIARTDAKSSGTIVVQGGAAEAKAAEEPTNARHILDLEIEKVSATYGLRNNGVTKWTIPVIMEFDNGANGGDEVIYQVPVIRHDDMPAGTYRVTIKGIPQRDYANAEAGAEPEIVPSYLYLDGLRIYQPMGETNDHYTADENGAVFYELRDQIMEGYAAAVQYGVDQDNVVLLTSTATTTWAENYSGKYGETASEEDETEPEEISYTSYQVESINDYLFRGPNNEVYMIGNELKSAIVFYVWDDGYAKTTAAAEEAGIELLSTGEAPSLQIALRAVDLGLAFGTESTKTSAAIEYGINEVLKDNGTKAWTPLVTAVSGTEQYYTIEYDKCPTVTVDNKTYYQVAIQVTEGMVSYSSLKLVGLELMELPDSFAYSDGTTLYYDEGILKDSAPEAGMMNTYVLLRSISAQMNTTVLAPIPADPVPLGPNGGDGGYVKPEIKDPEFEDDKDDEDDEDIDNTDRRSDSVVPILNLLSLTVKAGEGGTVSPEGDLIIAFGASRTFIITPDEGYEIADVLVNGKSVGAVAKYVLKAASMDTTIEVTFRKTETNP